MNTRWSAVALLAALAAAVACGSDQKGPSEGSGAAGTPGVSGSGGAGGSGGASAAGAAGTGATVGGGGASGQGGTGATAGSGATPATGGTAGSGAVAGVAGATASAGAAGSTAAAGAGGAAPRCTLTESGPVTATGDGEVIEYLHIVSDGGAPAIEVSGHSNVVIRHVRIEHSGGPGIEFSSADDLTVENVSIVHAGAPASGENPSSDLNNIQGYDSARPTITAARLTRGSSGIYLIQCPDSHLSFIEGHDFRGPFPRGQVVQWDNSDDGVLEDFSVINPPESWPEDNVNVYQSLNLTVRRGFIDGNNSPSGVGVIFDGGPSTGLVEDVDAIHMGNGCFSDYDGGSGVVFRRTRCRDNICESQGRGVPSSNALMWCGHTTHTDLRIEESAYFAACNPGNLYWPAESFEHVDLQESDFVPRLPIELEFCWE